MFEPFGNIKYCIACLKNISKFAFECNDDPVNKEHGPESANKAIDALKASN